MEVSPFIRAFLALFIITDSIGNLPVFMALTEKQSEQKRRNTLRIAVLTGFVLLLVVSLVGTGVLAIFNITLSDFRIAGGALLFVIAILILIGGKWTEEEDEDVGAVPLGCPLLVGPGAITTAIVLIGDFGLYVTLFAIMANFVVAWIIFLFAENIHKFLGHTGSKIVTKIMAILIAAIAIKFIHKGVFDIIVNYVHNL